MPIYIFSTRARIVIEAPDEGSAREVFESGLYSQDEIELPDEDYDVVCEDDV